MEVLYIPLVTEKGKKGLKTDSQNALMGKRKDNSDPITSMAGGAFIDIVGRDRLDFVSVCNLNMVAKLSHRMNAVTPQIIGGSFITTPIVAFVKKHLEGILEEFCLVNALKQGITKQRMMRI